MYKSIVSSLLKMAFVIFLLLVISIVPGAAISTQAQSNPEVDAKIKVGFDGHCKFGNWLPIHVDLSVQDSYFSGALSISYSQAEYLIPLALTPNAQKSISTQIFTNKQDVRQEITLRLIPDTQNEAPFFWKVKI